MGLDLLFFHKSGENNQDKGPPSMLYLSGREPFWQIRVAMSETDSLLMTVGKGAGVEQVFKVFLPKDANWLLVLSMFTPVLDLSGWAFGYLHDMPTKKQTSVWVPAEVLKADCEELWSHIHKFISHIWEVGAHRGGSD